MQHNNFREIARVGTTVYGVYTPCRAGANWGATAIGVATVAVDETIGRLGNRRSPALVAQAWATEWAAGKRAQTECIEAASELASAWAKDARRG